MNGVSVEPTCCEVCGEPATRRVGAKGFCTAHYGHAEVATRSEARTRMSEIGRDSYRLDTALSVRDMLYRQGRRKR
jgi:hypothetical protein